MKVAGYPYQPDLIKILPKFFPFLTAIDIVDTSNTSHKYRKIEAGELCSIATNDARTLIGKLCSIVVNDTGILIEQC